MIIREVKAKSIITKSNLPEADYVINPYIGCTHACIYCYASFMKRFTGHEEEWGTFLDVKINAPDLIPEKTNKYFGKHLYLSSVTDPYLPHEKKYALTRRILEKLIPLGPHIGIQSKSDLILRDLDLLEQFPVCETGLTITTLNDAVRKEIEPHTAIVQKRIEALKELKKAGLRTYVFIGPILPMVTDWKKIVLETQPFADRYLFENLNMYWMAAQNIYRWIKKAHPELFKEYQSIFGKNSTYWDQVELEIRGFCEDHGIDGRIFFHHAKERKP
ncbi:MAG: radical SAM protein [Desulfobacteraceae bacterium]|nr:radical SAM protein [Desulfobacteraceae bacterium]MBU4055009.1 radical SAM protein [Pseudomonadota bacterium]